MATQRYISTSFWDDEWVQTLDPSEKLLYLYYMTNPLTNIAGVYKISVRRISFDTGFTYDTIDHIMQKFEQAGKVHRAGEYIIIPSWPKHQRYGQRAAIRLGIISILKSLEPEIFDELKVCGYKFDTSCIDDPPTIPPPSPPRPRYSDSDLDTDTDIDLDSDSAARGLSELVDKLASNKKFT